MTIEQGGSLETYWSKDRIVTARFLKEHTPDPRISSIGDVFLVCTCGWSELGEDPNEWTVHLIDALAPGNTNGIVMMTSAAAE